VILDSHAPTSILLASAFVGADAAAAASGADAARDRQIAIRRRFNIMSP
jgi:hypothetical protein